MKAIKTDNYAILLAKQQVEDHIKQRMEVSDFIRTSIITLTNEDKLIALSNMYISYNGNYVFTSQISKIADEVLDIDASGVMEIVKSEDLTPTELNTLLRHEKITPFQAIAYVARHADSIETAREFLNMNVKLYEPMHRAIKWFALGERPHGLN